MKNNNQSQEPKKGKLKKIITYTTVSIIVLSIYMSTTDKKANNGFSTVLYAGEAKTGGTNHQPSKLKWFDSFKGINNMGK
jgi:hypothetical protein